MDQPVIVRKGTVEETMRRLEKYGVETKNKVLGKLDGTPVSSLCIINIKQHKISIN